MLRIFYGHAAGNLGDVAITAGIGDLLGSIDVGRYELMFPSSNNPFALRARSALERRLGQERCRYIDLESLEDRLSRFDAEELAERFERLDFPQDVWANLSNIESGQTDFALFSSCEHLFSNANAPRAKELAARLLPMYATGSNFGFLPITLGPIEDSPSRRVVRKAFSNCVGVQAREAASVGLVAELMGSRLVSGCGLLDPAFFLQELSEISLGYRPRTLVLVPRRERFGLRVGIGESRRSSKSMREQGYEDSEAFRLYAGITREMGSQFALIIMLVQTPADRELCKALRHYSESMDLHAEVRLIEPASFSEWKNVIGSARLVVTSRFHTAILALATCTPCVGPYFAEHGHKMPGLFRQFLLDDRAILVGGEVEENVERVASVGAQSSGAFGIAQIEVLRLLRRKTQEYVREMLETERY